MSELNEHYKQKYLKYKAKYMELKRYEQEGGLLDNGFGIVFTSNLVREPNEANTETNTEKLRKALKDGKISNKGDIGNLLDRQAYIIFDGKKSAELLESSRRIMKDKLSAAASSVASATKTGVNYAWNATKTGATMAASATYNAGVAVADAGVNQYKKYQDNKQKAADAATLAAYEQLNARSTNALPTNASEGNANVAALVGGGDLPLTIATLNNQSYDRANDAHKRHIAAAVAAALGLEVKDIATVSIKFKLFGRPELRD